MQPFQFAEMPYDVKLKSFNGVAAGQDATLDVRIGLTIHSLLIAFGGSIADYGQVNLKVNGTVVQSFESLQALDDYNHQQGRARAAATDGVIYLDFIRYGLDSPIARELTALATGANAGVSTVQLEIAVKSSATAPTLSAKAKMSKPRPRGLIKWIQRFNFNAAHTGENQWTDLPKGRHINQLHFKSGNVDALRIQRNQTEIFNRSKAENTAAQNDGKRNPLAGVFMFDPTEMGNGALTLPTTDENGVPVADLRFMMDVGTAGTFTILAETIGASPV